jgi:hypothetical protein
VSYPYKASPNAGCGASGQYVLLRYGKEVMRGTEGEVWQYIHRNHCYSVDHALKYEGYSIVKT